MKKIILTLLLVMFIIPSLYADEVTNENSSEPPQEQVAENQETNDNDEKEEGPITLKSKSGIVIDASSKKILFEKNSNETIN